MAEELPAANAQVPEQLKGSKVTESHYRPKSTYGSGWAHGSARTGRHSLSSSSMANQTGAVMAR